MSFIIRSQAAPTLPREGLNFWLDAQNHPSLGNDNISVDRTSNYGKFSINNNGTKVSYLADNGGSFVFNGLTDNYIKTPINITTAINSLTLVLWFRRGSTPTEYAGLFYNRTTGAIAGIHFGGSGNTTKLRYTWNNANFDVETNLNTVQDVWTFCSLSIRSNGATFTMITATGTKSSFSHTNLTNTALAFTSSFLGWDGSGSRYLIGRISQAFFYTRDLSDSEVQTIYDTTIHRYIPPTPSPTSTPTPTPTPTLPAVNNFVGKESGDFNELCNGGGVDVELYSTISWAALKAGVVLYSDVTLNNVWKDSKYFYNINENQYIEINLGDGKIVLEPTAC